jgi:hypothetical protein
MQISFTSQRKLEFTHPIVSTQQFRCVPRNIFRRCWAHLETEGRHSETLLGIKDAKLHGKYGLYRLPVEAGFVYYNAPATISVLRPEIRDNDLHFLAYSCKDET